MKKLSILIMAAVGLVANVALADMKVGVVDLREVLQKTPKMEAINQKLNKEFQPREDEIKKLQDNLQKDLEKLERDEAVLSEKDKSELQDKIMTERRKLQRLSAAFQEEAAVAQNKQMQALFSEIEKVVEKIAAKKELDLVLQSDGIPYYKPELDITKKVVEELK